MLQQCSPVRLLSALALVFLAACAVPPQPKDGYRIVNRTDIELQPLVAVDADQPFQRSFTKRNVDGNITGNGAWSIEAVVEHRQFRCGTYETGLQLGLGAPACTDVAWFGEPQFRTRETQCNSATLIHAGGGTLPLTRDQVARATCVRIVTRCSGVCS